MKIYSESNNFLLGITLKNEQTPENNNMAFHVAKSKKNVINNREKLAKSLNMNLNNFVFAQQTHSNNIYKVTKCDRGRGAYSSATAIPSTDALYTNERNIVLCTLAADCVPIIFYNENCGTIGVIHSGWRGTVNEITYHMFDHLINVEKCNQNQFYVYIGAAISQSKFEVDEDVYRKFIALNYADDFIYFNNETNKYHINNKLIVKKQCELLGIPTEQIFVDSMCTYKNDLGFSYRENKTSGRHMGFIVRK